MTFSHTQEKIDWISEQLARRGVFDFRFCIENDCYVCDRDGNFFSVCVRQLSRAGTPTERYEIRKLKGSVDYDGYTTYRITVDGVKKHLKGHRLMMNAWCGENPSKVVNHIDGNKSNNSLTNLEWCTVAENNAHAIKTGLYNPHAMHPKMHIIPPCEWVSIYIFNKHFGISFSELGRRYRCTHDVIGNIVRRLDKIFGDMV